MPVYGKVQVVVVKLKTQICKDRCQESGWFGGLGWGCQGQSCYGPARIQQLRDMCFPCLIHISGRKSQIFQSCLLCTSLTKKGLSIRLPFPPRPSAQGEEALLQGRAELPTPEEDKCTPGQPNQQNSRWFAHGSLHTGGSFISVSNLPEVASEILHWPGYTIVFGGWGQHEVSIHRVTL